MKSRNARRKQWKRWVHKEIRAGRTVQNGYGPFNGYIRNCHNWAYRGDWRKRIDRKWSWLTDMIE